MEENRERRAIINKPMVDFYQTNAKEYFDSTARIDATPFLLPLSKELQPGASIMDIGCGSGRDLRWLATRGFNPTGLERSPSLAAMAQEFSGCPVIEGDFLIFNFANLSFDALLLVGALVHVERSLLPEVLQRISGALAADGLIYLTLKEGTGERVADDGRVFTLWSQEQLEAIFRKLQFKVKDFSRQVSKLRSSDVWLGYQLSSGESNDSR